MKKYTPGSGNNFLFDNLGGQLFEGGLLFEVIRYTIMVTINEFVYIMVTINEYYYVHNVLFSL